MNGQLPAGREPRFHDMGHHSSRPDRAGSPGYPHTPLFLAVCSDLLARSVMLLLFIPCSAL